MFKAKLKVRKIPKPIMLIVVPTAFYTLAFFAFFIYGQHRHDPFWYRLGFFSTYISAALAFWVLAEKKTPSNLNFRFLSNCITLALFLSNAALLWGTWHALKAQVLGFWLRALLGLVFSLISEFRREKLPSHLSADGDSIIMRLQ